MYVRVGMWHDTHCAPTLPGACIVCAAASYLAGTWHCAHTALPSARSLPLCGSWQSLQVTPLACIFDCRNDAWS